jgi:hypothetical protein
MLHYPRAIGTACYEVGMSSRGIVFRTATAEDSAAVAALHTASWRSAYRGMLPDRYLDVAIDDERAQLWQARLAPSVLRYLWPDLAQLLADLRA